MILEIVTAGGAAVAALVAAWQLWNLRKDALDARVAEIVGVAVSTNVVLNPTPDEVVGGIGNWIYEYSITNPGRLPISQVEVSVEFPCAVRRRRWNDELEEPTRTLRLHVPVVPAHTTHPPRTRKLAIDDAFRDDLKDSKITIEFDTPDAGRWTNVWPRPPGVASTSRALNRRLRRSRGRAD
ncbi:hypothetical protein [Georgenia muralis]|uniref:hypothetical protein n=1 Tax=Georgenia muralis TaxID=154117 RepID=UPI000F4DBA1B|nr:hypothetical protein [Georgenia muralis]